MQQSLVAAVDWKRRWVYCVVCTSVGLEVTRALWPREEAAHHLPGYLSRQREKHGMPLVVTGRSGLAWPNALLEALWVSGFPVELYEGAPLNGLLRLEYTLSRQAGLQHSRLAGRRARRPPQGRGRRRAGHVCVAVGHPTGPAAC